MNRSQPDRPSNVGLFDLPAVAAGVERLGRRLQAAPADAEIRAAHAEARRVIEVAQRSAQGRGLARGD